MKGEEYYERLEILWKIKKNSHYNAPQLASEVYNEREMTITAETVRRVMKNNGYNGWIVRRKTYINEINRKWRLAYSKKFV